MAFNFLKPLTRHHGDKKNHTKLGEGWGENREPIKDGVTFYVKSLGSTLVEELTESGQSYGEGISSVAVQAVVGMAKSQGKKLPKVALLTSPCGIAIRDFNSNATLMDIPIDRIRFCTADSHHEKVFAFIARNTDNETMECHAFLCAKKKMAQAVTLSVAQAFNIAYDEWQEQEKMEMHNSFNTAQPKGVKHKFFRSKPGQQFSFSSQSVQSASQSSVPKPEESPTKHLLNVMEPRDGLSTNEHRPVVPMLLKPSTNGHPRSRSDVKPVPRPSRQNWVSFDDDEASECPSSQLDPFTFGTNLRSDDIDEGVRSFMVGGNREEFTRQKSIDDLLSL